METSLTSEGSKRGARLDVGCSDVGALVVRSSAGHLEDARAAAGFAEEHLLESRQDRLTRIAMIEHQIRGGDVTVDVPDSSQGDVRAAPDSWMMWHREVHVGKRSHAARHVSSVSRFSFTSAQFLFRHEPGGPMIR
ncbi:hypothetical protein Taro_031532 [Colocasia esculenta]|uniref:Uncharacterized protein n=1 Tax=Colocasia esculenta TaxID=4460 RepID=A0A843VZA8_COLES|nr:hypothetical protein [Colocasia esculenta]